VVVLVDAVHAMAVQHNDGNGGFAPSGLAEALADEEAGWGSWQSGGSEGDYAGGVSGHHRSSHSRGHGEALVVVRLSWL
jgi:hypothetical protein